VTPGCGELKRLYVKSGLQGAGIGNALLDAALGWLEKPARKLWIGVFSENHGAQKLYGRRGFTRVGEYKFLVGAAEDQEYILRRG
jgi:ribosomal protein S18 acetylase RimI-like enzyme